MIGAGLRVLVAGELWWGSTLRACAGALRRHGCVVSTVDEWQYLPQATSLALKVLCRLAERWQIDGYNEAILRACERFQVDVFFTVKGNYIQERTVRALGERGVTTVNFYPDTSARTHRALEFESLRAYRVFFVAKGFQAADARGWGVAEPIFIPHGYDAEVHRELAGFGAAKAPEVCFVANRTAHKEELLDAAIREWPEMPLRIYGGGWGMARISEGIRSRWEGWAPAGDAYAEVLQRYLINLAILSGKVDGASQGDETTTRTFEVPACAGFMLHERTPEVLTLFREGEEIGCFDGARELVEKVQWHLAHRAETEAMAARGRARCVPAYSCDARVGEMLGRIRGAGR